MTNKRKTQIKRILYWLILIGFVYVIAQNITDFKGIYKVLKRGDLLLIAFAVVLQGVSIIFMSSNMKNFINIIGVRMSLFEVIKQYLSMSFINIITPFGSTGGMLYMSKKVSEKSYLGIAGMVMMIYMSYWILTSIYIIEIFISIIALEFQDFKGISPIIVAFMLLILMQVVTLIIVIISMKRPLLLKKLVYDIRELFGTLGGLLNNSFFGAESRKVNEWLDDINLTSHILKENHHIKDYLKSFLYALLSFIAQFVLLWILFQAFQIKVTFMQVFVSQAIIYLFTMISPTPSGVGIVEGVAQLVFVGIGVPKSGAVVITFAYRGIVIWLPVFIGFFFFRSANKGTLNI